MIHNEKMNIHTLTPPGWSSYELLDSGDKQKLERFGSYILSRFEPRALWPKSQSEEFWKRADACHIHKGEKGSWQFRTKISEPWIIPWGSLRFRLRPTSFKHIGIFPEMSVHWSWIIEKIRAAKRQINVLNLFAYTGGCTLAASLAGAAVTHLDASKETVTWAHENAKLSGLSDRPVRWIVDDATTFVKRELKRNHSYDGIIIDPPKFGRSENGKLWKIEDDLLPLLQQCWQLRSKQPLFIILNTCTVAFSSVTLANLLIKLMKDADGVVENGEILIPQKVSQVSLPTSIFAKWSAAATY